MLIIIEDLKQFRTILLGKILRIYTDHKKITCDFLNTDRVLRWRLILEEYAPEIEYIQCDKNKVADAISRLAINGNQQTTQAYTHKKEFCQK